nr:DUF2716 domain-containing protein [Amycolatopsis umgeniensis]
MSRETGDCLWEEFVSGYSFTRSRRPAIREPAPSVTWALPPCGGPGRPFLDAALPVAQLVCDVLRECVEYWDSVFHHDGVHFSTQYRPHRVVDVRDVEKWEYLFYPNGDFSIFVAKDLSFGVVGNPFEESFCVFGESAVAAAERHNAGLLTEVLRRDGIAVSQNAATATPMTQEESGFPRSGSCWKR